MSLAGHLILPSDHCVVVEVMPGGWPGGEHCWEIGEQVSNPGKPGREMLEQTTYRWWAI